MKDYKVSVEEHIKKSIFSKTGEAFLDSSNEEDNIYSEFNYVGQLLRHKYIVTQGRYTCQIILKPT